MNVDQLEAMSKDALAQALSGNMLGAQIRVKAIEGEFGPNGLSAMLVFWCNDAISRRGLIPSRDLDVELTFHGVAGGVRVDATVTQPDTPSVTDAPVPGPIAWAGQLISARLRNDVVTFQALVSSTPRGQTGIYLRAALFLIVAFVTENAVILTGQDPDDAVHVPNCQCPDRPGSPIPHFQQLVPRPPADPTLN